jgi:hypothetical protein
MTLRHAWRLWSRAFLIVSLTAGNVVNVSRGHYFMAFITGGSLSYVWFGNAQAASRSVSRYDAVVYAFGAACGTAAGMFLGRLL